jgi:hypothetical protein
METKTVNNISAWHYTQDASWISPNDCVNLFMEKIKKTHPKIDLPIQVGWTGYIDFETDDRTMNGWTFDTLDRFVCQIDGIRMFQRYQLGDRIMWDPSKGDDWVEMPRKMFEKF